MSSLDYLSWLREIRDISLGRQSSFDPTKFEKDFIQFSSYCKKEHIIVNKPKLYRLEGDKKRNLEDALKTLNFFIEKIPEAIDISGGFNYTSGIDNLIFVSPQQMQADHFTTTRSYLNPLIEKIYTEGLSLVTNFCVNEALCGKVKYSRGSLLLEDIALFPEKFQPGPYDLSVRLDTPLKTIEQFRYILSEMQELRKEPKIYLLNSLKIQNLTSKSLQLRELLGSLSRYEFPEKQEFRATTNSCVIKKEDTTFFYLFTPKKSTNLLVYFGSNPFIPKQTPPSDLIILNGREHQNTLVKLLEFEIVKPSKTVIEQRLHDFTRLYEEASRSTQTNLIKNHQEFSFIIDCLKTANTYFNSVINKNMLKEYVMRQPPECVEFMVCPDSEDPLFHELLPRLSWNNSLRTYHHTKQFISSFINASREEKKQRIREIAANILFHNHQNNNVNNWLYENHQDICSEAGIIFEVRP